MSIRAEHVRKRFGAFVALHDVTIDFPDGALTALLGPSGCGKTTLLRVIGGLETPDEGRILFDGEDATSRHARERRVGFVFQHYALFRHMSVFENVAFGLRARSRGERPSDGEIRKRVMDLLELVRLEGFAQRWPAQLSGGQRQRVALARALAVEPKALLLDEPFGALDAQVRKELRRWLRRLHDELHVTSIFVTHDQEEALEVADSVVVMNAGRIEQIGAPHEVYGAPASAFVYGFLGASNIFHGRVEGGMLRAPEGLLRLEGAPLPEGAEAAAYVRPHEIALVRAPQPGAVAARVRRTLEAGPILRLELEAEEGGAALEAEIAPDAAQGLGVGDRVWAAPRRLRAFPVAGGLAPGGGPPL